MMLGIWRTIKSGMRNRIILLFKPPIKGSRQGRHCYGSTATGISGSRENSRAA